MGWFKIRINTKPQVASPDTTGVGDQVEALQAYLNTYNSPIPADILLEKAPKTWRYLLSISWGESRLGKEFVGCDWSYNIWGIKPAGRKAESCNIYLRYYDTWAEAIEDAD